MQAQYSGKLTILMVAAWLNENPDKIVLAPDIWINNVRQDDIYSDYMIRIKHN